MKIPKESPIDGQLLKRIVQRKSDAILGLDKINYEQFCDKVDEITHPNMMDYYNDMPIGNTRELHKMLGKHLHENSGVPYYELWLDIVYSK